MRSKGRQRQCMREAFPMYMQDVPKADVLMNPTHLAVAIKYDAEVSRAPIVIAKGEDYLAQKIREKAKENHIEIGKLLCMKCYMRMRYRGRNTAGIVSGSSGNSCYGI